MTRQNRPRVVVVLGFEDVPDLVDGKLDRTERDDRPRARDLIGPVVAVARPRIDVDRLQDLFVVVMTERRDGQTAHHRERPDGQKVISWHDASMESPVTGESSPIIRSVNFAELQLRTLFTF